MANERKWPQKLYLNNKRVKSGFYIESCKSEDVVKTAVHLKCFESAAQHIFIEILVQYCTVGMLHFINLS